MINLKEKKLLVKMNAALGQPSDPALLAEIATEEARLQEEQSKLNELLKKQSKTIGAAFADLTKDINKLIAEEKKKTKEEELILERFSNIITEISKHKPILEEPQPIIEEPVAVVNEVVLPEIVEDAVAAIEPTKPKSLVDVVVEKVSSTSTPSVFVQPDPPLVERDIQSIQQKLKLLEGWVSKISMAGPGGGAVWLKDLDDVSHSSMKGAQHGQVLVYNSLLKKWEAAYLSNANGEIDLTDYQTTAGLSANVAKLTANNSLFLGSVAANQYAYANTFGNVSFSNTTISASSNASLIIRTTLTDPLTQPPSNNVPSLWTFTNQGELRFPSGAVFNGSTLVAPNTNSLILSSYDNQSSLFVDGIRSELYSNGVNITAAGDASLAKITNNDKTWSYDASGVLSFPRLTSNATVYTDFSISLANGYVELLAGMTSPHTAPPTVPASYKFGSEWMMVPGLLRLSNTTNYITGATGSGVTVYSGANVTIQAAGDSQQWKFGSDGTLSFPDNTTQNTAWTGNVSSISWTNGSPAPGTPFSTVITANNSGAVISLSSGLPGLGTTVNWVFDDVGISFPNSIGYQTVPFVGDADLLGGIAADQYAYANGSNFSVNNSITLTYAGATPTGYPLIVNASNTQGGSGYSDFLKVTNKTAGATANNKSFRLNSTGAIEIINSAYSATILSLSDVGAFTVPGPISVGGKQAVNGPAFSAYAAAVLQTIPTGVQTKVLFQTEEFDTNSNYASSRFTPTVEGYYQLNAEVRLDGATGTGECMIILYKNGSEYKRGWNSSGTQWASNFWAMQVSSVAYANGTGDYFEIYVQQGSGGTISITAVNNSAITWFNGCMLRGA